MQPVDIVDELTAGAATDDECLLRFQHTLQSHIALPCKGSVVGTPVEVIEFVYSGNQRRAITARCRRAGRREYEVSAADVVIATDVEGSQYLSAYRQWMGLTAWPSTQTRLSGSVDLVVLSVKQRAARCRLLGSDRIIILRAALREDFVPGEIARVQPHKQWDYAGTAYIAGVIESARLDAAALGLVPLKMEDCGVWDPAEAYWGEEGEPIAGWARPIIAWGPRRRFEMEQVLPGEDPDDPFSDPILEANDRKDGGDRAGAYRILMDLCAADLRCLDAHAHLGNLAFDLRPEMAIRHYEAGFRIGELSLGRDFDGVLSWSLINNRPFLRCMNGYGLCLWRLGRFAEAKAIFDRMLWLNPTDHQGVRFLINDVQAKVAWRDPDED